MSAFDAVNLDQLPAPQVLEALDYEAILQELLDDLAARFPEFDALVESEPGVKLAEVVAFHALQLRARVNDAAKSLLLAFAAGSDLDHLAANFSIARQVVTPADPVAVPPVPAVLEDDTALRRRVQLALEAATAAGTAGRYLFYSLSADGRVADAAITSPLPGDVLATVLSTEGDGTPDAALLQTVETALTDPEIRQLNDTILVAAATIIPFAIEATLFFKRGAAAEVAFNTATANLDRLLAEPARMGRDVRRSEIHAALHIEGVSRVDLIQPAADVVIAPTEAASVTTVTLTDGGLYE
ncbi:MAG: baseplate J/gp47 family protein [Pseudomonadota bacterium]